MPYYEVANPVTVTKTTMIDEMPCAYGTLRVASGPIYILLMYPMNPFGRMVTVGHNPTVIVYNVIPRKRYETTKLRSEGSMQHDASYCGWARSSLPLGCLWRLWWSMSTLTEPFRPDGNGFCWWPFNTYHQVLPRSALSYTTSLRQCVDHVYARASSSAWHQLDTINR